MAQTGRLEGCQFPVHMPQGQDTLVCLGLAQTLAKPFDVTDLQVARASGSGISWGLALP